MAESIKREIEQLETVGRVSAGGGRQVHTGFGFSKMKKREDAPKAVASATGDVADDLDDAFARLKASTPAE